MFFSPPVMFESRMAPTSLRGAEHGDLPIDDPPPMEHPSESYSSWRPTSIFSLAPFTAPQVK